MAKFFSRRIGIWCFAGIFGAVGVLMLAKGAWPVIALAHASRQWPRTSGVVTSARLVTSSNEGTSYRAQIDYAYTVDGVSYSGHRVRAGGNNFYGPIAGAQKTLDRYPVGVAAGVAYDPADPVSSLLEPGDATAGWFLAGMGSLFALGGSIAVATLLLRPGWNR